MLYNYIIIFSSLLLSIHIIYRYSVKYIQECLRNRIGERMGQGEQKSLILF